MRVPSLISCSLVAIALTSACPSGALAQQTQVTTLDASAAPYGVTLQSEPGTPGADHLDGGMLAGGIVLTVVGAGGIVVGGIGAVLAGLAVLLTGDARAPAPRPQSVSGLGSPRSSPASCSSRARTTPNPR